MQRVANPKSAPRPQGFDSLTLRKQTEPEFAQIHRVADSLTPDLRRRFLAALETLKRQIPLDTLADLIDKGAIGDIGQLIAGLDVEVRGLIETVSRKAIQGVGDVTAAGFGFDFALDNPAVVRWIDGNAGKLITGITSETQKAVVDIVRNGFVEGVPPKAMARQIRRVVGLTARDAGAVDRFWRKIVEDRDDVAFADRQADRMRDKLLRRRAETIARTEAIRAANTGQLMAWEQAADEGLINRETTRRVWISTEDDRVCPICAVLDGQTVGFSDNFDASQQATGFEIVAAGEVAGTPQKDIKVTGTKPRPAAKSPQAQAERTPRVPPAHPRGRCAVGLVFDEAVVRPGNFEGRDDAEAYLRSLGIKDVNLEGITRVESLNEIGQAVEVVHDRYPWMAEKFGTTRGLNRVVTNTERLEHFGAAAQVRGTTAGIEISLRPGIFNDSTVMSLMAAGDGSHFSTVLHELGHVAERTLVGAGRVSAPSAFSATVGNGPWAGLQRGRRMFLREVSMYAEESGAEFFAEMFEIKNRTGYAGHLKNAYWRREAVPAAALKRLEAAERWIEDQLSGPLTTGRLGIDPEDIL